MYNFASFSEPEKSEDIHSMNVGSLFETNCAGFPQIPPSDLGLKIFVITGRICNIR
jgi:hypothetical protein